MIFNMVGGSGTGGASIFIVNSVNQRPTNVFNNTLWVNTDVDVVKYVFSDNEPSNPTEGMLWLIISNSDNVNVAAPINKDWMKFNLGIVRQYIDGAWERKVAQLYKDGIWVDVSRMFSASINITYPANSNCVVTNSSGQTVASDTNTGSSTKTWTATVNATGTYTVTATVTDGSDKTASKTVSITTEGQTENVTLTYELYLLQNGVQKTEFRTNTYAGTVTFESSAVKMAGDTTNLCTSSKIDVSAYSSLKVTYSGGYSLTFGVRITDPADHFWNGPDLASVQVSQASSPTTAVVDISNINQAVYVQIYSHLETAYIYSIWLE